LWENLGKGVLRLHFRSTAVSRIPLRRCRAVPNRRFEQDRCKCAERSRGMARRPAKGRCPHCSPHPFPLHCRLPLHLVWLAVALGELARLTFSRASTQSPRRSHLLAHVLWQAWLPCGAEGQAGAAAKPRNALARDFDILRELDTTKIVKPPREASNGFFSSSLAPELSLSLSAGLQKREPVRPGWEASELLLPRCEPRCHSCSPRPETLGCWRRVRQLGQCYARSSCWRCWSIIGPFLPTRLGG
jgi:hypothetical protein